MARKTQAERRAAGMDVLRTLRGGTTDPAAAAADLETRLGALGSYAVDFAMGDIWSRDGLTRRDRSLVVCTILITLNQLNQLRSHAVGAVNHGLTRTELEEACIQLSAYAGFPRAIDGMTTIREALAAAQGVDALDPSPPAEVKEDDRRSDEARDVMARMSENQSFSGVGVDMGSITGAAGRFAFGEVWARGELSRRDRSLVVCTTLTTQDKPTELRFHVQAALNHGVTETELEELMVTHIAYAGFPTAVEGLRVFREVTGG